MRKYILALILGIGIVFQYQSVYAQVDDVDSDNTLATQTVDKNILANEELMKTITPEQLEEYIAKGADVNARSGKYGWTPLMFATLYENPKIMQLLINHGAYTEIRDSIGNTALMNALLSFNKDIMQINECVNNKELNDTVIKYMKAGGRFASSKTKKSNFEVIETLLKNGANANIENTFGMFVFVFLDAFLNGKTDTGSDVVIEPNKDVVVEMVAFIEDVMKKGVNSTKQLRYSVTPLQIAIARSDQKVIEALLKAGADANKAKILTGNSLLYLALFFKDDNVDKNTKINIIDTLLAYGAVPNDDELVPILKSNYLEVSIKDKIYNEWQKQNRIKAKEDFSKK